MRVVVDTEPIEAILSPELIAVITQHGMYCRTLSVGIAGSTVPDHVGAIVVIGETQAEADARAAVLEAAVRHLSEGLAAVADGARRREQLGPRPWERKR